MASATTPASTPRRAARRATVAGLRVAVIAALAETFFGCDGAIASRGRTLPDIQACYAQSTERSASDRRKRDGGCLHRVDAVAPHARAKLFCTSSDGCLVFRLAAHGKTAVVGAETKVPELTMGYTRLSLLEGRILGTPKIPLASSFDLSLATSGSLVTLSGRGVVVADASGAVRVVPGLEDAFVSMTPHWDGDRLYALRTGDPSAAAPSSRRRRRS